MKVGDLLLAFVTIYNAATISAPAGWSTVVPQWAATSAAAMNAAVFSKVATLADIRATFTFTNGAVASYWSGGIVCLPQCDDRCRRYGIEQRYQQRSISERRRDLNLNLRQHSESVRPLILPAAALVEIESEYPDFDVDIRISEAGLV